MRRLGKPSLDHAEVLDACISEVHDAALAARFNSARPHLLAKFKDYEKCANAHTLFSFDACAWGNGAQTVLADMTKTELIDLYSDRMVSGGKLGRKHYDGLLMLAPLGKCPFCGFGQVSTLDHFLSKSRYPAFSVLSCNLVPSCADCNKGKSADVLTEASQILHPYFEDAVVETVPWLFSKLIESQPAAVLYFAQPPTDWPKDLISRVSNHFYDLKLAKRFGVEAASELAGLTGILNELKTSDARELHLLAVARAERRRLTNSWRAALYETLANSAWYKNDGFRNM